ncbi:MAG: DUF6273 domain-containing protein [Gracilibacteraceae bacterium]|nr:DUF6273 domain-containing protein [Gracilibacteraceae bacterium]
MDLARFGIDEEEINVALSLMQDDGNFSLHAAGFGLADFYNSQIGGMVRRDGRFNIIAFIQSWGGVHKEIPGPRNITYAMTLNEVLSLFPVQNEEVWGFLNAPTQEYIDSCPADVKLQYEGSPEVLLIYNYPEAGFAFLSGNQETMASFVVFDEGLAKSALALSFDENLQLSNATINNNYETEPLVTAEEMDSYNSATDMYQTMEFGSFENSPLEWLILEEDADRMLLLAKNCVASRMYDVKWKDAEYTGGTTWEKCDLRRWLNEDFYGRFTDAEKSRIMETKLSNPDSEWVEASGGNPTTDRLFLLTPEDAFQYFPDDVTRMAYYYGEYTWENETLVSDGTFHWWLRAPGAGDYMAAIVMNTGEVFTIGAPVGEVNWNLGVRPAFWMQKNQVD